MEFDVTRENDIDYLIAWYQYRIRAWEQNKSPNAYKIVNHYRNGIKNLKQTKNEN